MISLNIPPNAIFQADCSALLERLKDESAKLVYLDPPFFPRGEILTVENGSPLNRDLNFDEYLEWFTQELSQAYRVTELTGNIIIHTEPRINSYIRLISEDLFEKVEFTEIILRKPKRFLSHNKPYDEHETLLVCRKSEDSIWNSITRPFSSEEVEQRFTETDFDGRRFVKSSLIWPVDRQNRRKSWQDYTPPIGQSWRFSEDVLNRLQQEGRIYYSERNKHPYLKIYADESAGVPIGTNWDDMHQFLQAIAI